MTKEALKLALEALEYASTGNRRPEIIGPAITAIKEALAQPEPEGEPDENPVQSTCSDTLRLQGKAYPRTCKKCGLGPCTGKPVAQPEDRNFCPRCGKRTADLTTIHTCTPPQIDPNQWAFDNGLEST
jgi:hypothetical protein